MLAIMTVFLLVFTLANVSAVQYWQYKEFKSDDTIEMRAFMGWDVGDLTSDHIKTGNKLQTYVLYDVYTADWNLKNTNYTVDNCNFTIEFSDVTTGQNSILYNEVFTGATTDVSRAKFFVQLDKGDSYTAVFNCKFSGQVPELLEMPVTMSLVTPTWECKACQYYEWSKLDIDIQEAKTIGDNTLDVIQYIKALIVLNYEFVIIFFWIFLISIGMFGFSLIFIGVYWLYLYLRGVSKIK